MGTDPFEDFEFKPLTEGLGFHQKPTATPAGSSGILTPASAQQLKARGINFEEFDAELSRDENENPFSAPLPRRETKANSAPTSTTPPPSAVDDILNTLQKNRQLEIETDRRQRAELRQPGKRVVTWKTAAPRFAPMFLDGMLITAASLLCLIAMLVITRVDLVANLANPDASGMIYGSTIALFATVTFIYMVVNRVFLGATPGEWAYDLRLGRPEDQDKALYVGQVVARQLLLTVTGLVILPLVGLAMGRDVAGNAVKLPLQRKG